MASKNITDLQVVYAVDRFWGRPHHPDLTAPDILHQIFREPVKICCYAIERAIRHGLLEGALVTAPIITAMGRELLERARPGPSKG